MINQLESENTHGHTHTTVLLQIKSHSMHIIELSYV